MKKSALFLFSGMLLLSSSAWPIGFGYVAPTTVAKHSAACIVSLGGLCIQHSPVSLWIDPALVVATGLDLLATKDQNEKTVDAKDAINELEESLKGGGCGSGSQGQADATSLSVEDLNVYAPEIVVKALDDSAEFESVRESIEEEVFENTSSEINGECRSRASNKDCAVERQNTWTLVSVTLAESMADKLLFKSKDMSGRYAELVSFFNEQTSPMDMWGAMNVITVDTHKQVNDLNALYARALEVNALSTLNESGVIKLKRSEKTSTDEEEEE